MKFSIDRRPLLSRFPFNAVCFRKKLHVGTKSEVSSRTKYLRLSNSAELIETFVPVANCVARPRAFY